MATDVVYARVPKKLKDAVDVYASEKGKTLTGAVVDLLDRGLIAATDERSIVALEKNLAEVSAQRDRAVADSQVAQAELNALKTFGQRAARPASRWFRVRPPGAGRQRQTRRYLHSSQ